MKNLLLDVLDHNVQMLTRGDVGDSSSDICSSSRNDQGETRSPEAPVVIPAMSIQPPSYEWPATNTVS